jgi:hypothetical protein
LGKHTCQSNDTKESELSTHERELIFEMQPHKERTNEEKKSEKKGDKKRKEESKQEFHNHSSNLEDTTTPTSHIVATADPFTTKKKYSSIGLLCNEAKQLHSTYEGIPKRRVPRSAEDQEKRRKKKKT